MIADTFLNSENKQYTFDNYHSDTPVRNKGVIENIIANDFKDIDFLAIFSTMGNGSTHLLKGTISKLLPLGKPIVSLTGERLFIYHREACEEGTLDILTKEIVRQKYLFIDGAGAFIGLSEGFGLLENRSKFIKWFNLIISDFFKNGGKLIFTTSNTKMEYCQIPDFLKKNYKYTQVISEFPSPAALKKIAKQAFDDMKLHYKPNYEVPGSVLNDLANSEKLSVRVLELNCLRIHINGILKRKKPKNKGLEFYMDMVRQYDWDKDQLEELTELTGAFVNIFNHKQMIMELKKYGVEL